MNISAHQPDFTYLEFGRNKVSPSDCKSCSLVLSSTQMNQFKQTYDSFMEEIQADDDEFGASDSQFKELSYPRWDLVLTANYHELLINVINNYLFVEFFSQFFSTEGSNKVCRVRSLRFELAQVVLELDYLEF